MTDSPFGPVRKFGRMDPNVYHEISDIAQWQSIQEALGDDVCYDTGVIHEPSAEEREMARLEATFPALADPTNTVAMQTAPVLPKRGSIFQGIAVGLLGSLIIAAAVVGVVNVALWVMS